MAKVDPVVAEYLTGSAPFKLEIGASKQVKPGWLASDLLPRPGLPVFVMDATKPFPIPSQSFDFVYSEHMIEHITFDDGQLMLKECARILKPGGVIRIVTPSLGLLLRITSSDRTVLEDRYREWSVRRFVRTAPAVTNAFFLNNFVRNWGHQFIYDHETLQLALQRTGFRRVTAYQLNASGHAELRGLENEGRLQPGFLDLESMVMEGEKPLMEAAFEPRALLDAESGLTVTFDAEGVPKLAAGRTAAAQGVLLVGPYRACAALIWLPTVQACRANRDGSLIADRPHVQAHESFALRDAGSGHWRLSSHWGGFLRVRADGYLDAAATEAEAGLFTLAERRCNEEEAAQLRSLKLRWG